MLNWHSKRGTPFPREAFSPAMLFRSGADGLWADPSDMSTMFQDSAGVTPVTAPGQAVGLMLDKHEFKGPNIFVPGNIEPNSWTVEGDTYSREAGEWDNLGPEGMEANTYYEIEFEIVEVVAGDIRIYRRNAADTSNDVVKVYDTPGKYRAVVRGNAVITAGMSVWFDSNTFTGSMRGISFRKVPGYQLTQPTASKRPIYGVVPSSALKYLPELVPDRWIENPTGIWGGSPAVQFTRDDTHAKQGTHSLQFASGPAAGFYDMFSLTDLEIGEVVTYGVWVYRADENANADFGWSLNGGWGVVSLNALPVGKWTYVTATAASPVAGASDLELREPWEQAIGNLWFDGLTIKRHKQGGRRNLLSHTENFDPATWTAYFQRPVFVGGQADPFGGNDAVKFNKASTTGGGSSDQGGVYYLNYIADDAQITASVWAKASAPTTIRFGTGDGTPGTNLTFNLTSEWVRLTVTGLKSGTDRIFQLDDDGGNEDIDIFLYGPQAEYGAEATPYQRVGNQYDVTERGVETLHYLHFDGVDDAFDFPEITSSLWTAVSAGSLDEGTNVIAMLLGHTEQPTKLGNNSGAPFFRGGSLNNSLSISGGLTDLEPHIFTGAVDGVNQQLRFDAGQERAGLVQGVPSKLNYFGQADVGQYWRGKIFGTVLTASYLSMSQRDKTERYLARKSGVTL